MKDYLLLLVEKDLRRQRVDLANLERHPYQYVPLIDKVKQEIVEAESYKAHIEQMEFK